MASSSEAARDGRTRRSTRPAPIALAASHEVGSCERGATSASGGPSGPPGAPGASPGETSPGEGRRARKSFKRTRFEVPAKMPWPVRALWQTANEEEQKRAHETATAILRTWLGQTTREEAAKELSLSGVRFWQLSQQAVCGLVVGCLRQPRFRPRRGEGAPTGPSTEGLGVLRQRISVLEKELDSARRLIEVLRTLPARREEASASSAEPRRGRGTRRGRRGEAAAADRRGAPVDRNAAGAGDGS
jgi:hypothetical protein